MATFAARRLTDMAENAATVIGIEIMAACQSIDFHKGLKTSEALFAVYRQVREKVPFLDRDRLLTADIHCLRKMVLAGGFNDKLPAVVPSLAAG